jgi:hypothetical protein
VNALEIIQRTTDALSIPQPSAVVGVQQDHERQLLELLNQEGRALSARFDWQALQNEATFTTVATESQGTLTSIIGATQSLRKIVNDTIWDRTQSLPICGPVSRRDWQARLATPSASPYSEYRIRGGQLLLYPAPTAGHSCYFEYVSASWCTDATGATYRRNIANDTDEVLLNDELMCAGLEWRWLRKKGLSYAEEFANYEALYAQLTGNDGTKPRLSMDGETRRRAAGIVVPIGNWPL